MPPSEPRQRLPDADPEETDEWMEALRSVVASQGVERARLLLHELMAQPDRVLTRDRLEQALYGWNEDVDSNTLSKRFFLSFFEIY